LATRLYFHSTNSALSNLPTTDQSSLTNDKIVDALTVNRSMNTTIGTAQTSLALSSNNTTSIQRYYYTRFVSDSLNGISSISANTWTYNFAAQQSSTFARFPAGVNGPVRVTCYVWRPSSSTKIADILDGNSNNVNQSVTTEISFNLTFTGAAVASIVDGDVIVFEVWFETTAAIAGAYTQTFYYDGTTVTTTTGTVVSNHASFIETPQSLTFGGGGAGSVTCTPTSKTVYNKTAKHG
jgi:hypothetical protein